MEYAKLNYNLPTFLIPALVWDDIDGLNEFELEILNEFTESIRQYTDRHSHWEVNDDTQPYFSADHDLLAFDAMCQCQDVTLFYKP